MKFSNLNKGNIPDNNVFEWDTKFSYTKIGNFPDGFCFWMSDVFSTQRQASFQVILCLEQDTQFLSGAYFAFSMYLPKKKKKKKKKSENHQKSSYIKNSLKVTIRPDTFRHFGTEKLQQAVKTLHILLIWPESNLAISEVSWFVVKHGSKHSIQTAKNVRHTVRSGRERDKQNKKLEY